MDNECRSVHRVRWMKDYWFGRWYASVLYVVNSNNDCPVIRSSAPSGQISGLQKGIENIGKICYNFIFSSLFLIDIRSVQYSVTLWIICLLFDDIFILNSIVYSNLMLLKFRWLLWHCSRFLVLSHSFIMTQMWEKKVCVIKISQD